MPHRYKWLLMSTLLLFLLSSCAIQSQETDIPSAKNGVLTLSEWNPATHGNVSLDVDWAFYWNELLQPGEFTGKEPLGYYRLPSGWAKYKNLSLPVHGTATYLLMVKTNASPGIYGIYVPNVYTEYALYINGALIHSCGGFTQDKTAFMYPQVYDFYLEDSELEIILQVKNDALIYGGGVGQSIRLGTSAQIHSEYNKMAAVDLVLISICLFAGLYFLVLYRFKPENYELIWLFLLCISVALRNALSNTTLLMQVFSGLPFLLGSRLVMLTIPSIMIAMLLYTRQLYGDEMPKAPFILLLSLNGLYALTVLFLSSTAYTAAFVPYLLAVAAACALGFYVSVKALKHKKPESSFFFAGMLILIAGGLHDSLVYFGVISIRYMLSVALLGFIVIQLILLSKRYSEAFRHVKLLSDDLQATLEKVTNTETAYMSAQMKPHFLYNALSTIAECCETDAAAAGKLILSLSKYLRQTLDYDNTKKVVPLKKELELVQAYASIEKARFANINFVFDLPDPLPPLQIPPLTLQPLVENAVKHGLFGKREGGSVILRMQQTEKSAVLSVEDNGVGITDDILKNLAVRPSGSTSIGLYNINTRLIRIYGAHLNIISEPGVGTRVSFEIPCEER